MKDNAEVIGVDNSNVWCKKVEEYAKHNNNIIIISKRLYADIE